MNIELYTHIRTAIGTQAKVAALLGVTESAIKRRETGRNPITAEMAMAIVVLQSTRNFVPGASAAVPEQKPVEPAEMSLADAEKVLGLPEGADFDAVKIAWKTKAVDANPLLNPKTGSVPAFERISGAYTVILKTRFPEKLQ